MKEFPIDVALVNKGDVISKHRLSRIFGVPLTSRRYSYLLAGFMEELARRLRLADRPYTVCSKDDDILILTDSGALAYNRKRFRKGRKVLSQAHRRLEAVDTRNLSDAERKEHGRAVVVQGAMLAGMEDGRAGVLPIVNRRNTPGLVPANP